jgi:hypothetical protein
MAEFTPKGLEDTGLFCVRGERSRTWSVWATPGTCYGYAPRNAAELTYALQHLKTMVFIAEATGGVGAEHIPAAHLRVAKHAPRPQVAPAGARALQLTGGWSSAAMVTHDAHRIHRSKKAQEV